MKIPRHILTGSILLLSPIAFAASDTWKTTAGSGNWNTAGNWVGGVNPGNGTTAGSNTDVATFTGTSNFPSVNLSTDRNLGGMTFNGAGAYTITSTNSGAGRYFFTRGGTTQMTSGATASQDLIGAFIRLGQGISGSNNYTFLNNATSSANVFSLGAIRNASNVSSTVIFGGANTGLNKVIGVVDETSGGANVLAVNKQGAGTWILDTANTYTGGTTIDAGILGVGSATALGTGGLTINGGAIAASASTRTLTNNITVAGDFSFGGLGATGASIVLNGTAGLGGATRSATLAGNSVTLGGVISNGGLTIESNSGTRSLTINGAGSNTYTGTTTVNGGTVTLAKTGGAIAVAGDLAINTVASAGTVLLGASNQIATTATATVSTGGTLDLATFNQSLTGVVLTGGSITGTSGVLTGLTNDFDLRSGSVSAKLGGSVGLDKTTGGTVTLSGANTFTGATTVSSGTLEAAAAGALTTTSGITANSGGTLLLSGSGDRISDTAPFTLDGGTFSTAGLSETVGALTLTADSFIDLGAGSSILTFADSSASSWGSFRLSIYNWSGNTMTGGGTDQLRFVGSGLTLAQLSQIDFYSGTTLGTKLSITPTFTANGFVGAFGEVVPVPEPSGVFVALGLFGLAGWRERHKAMGLRAAERRAAAHA